MPKSVLRRRVLECALPSLLIFDGNSMTFGVGSTLGLTYPVQTVPLLPRLFDARNIGVSSQTTVNMSTQAPLYIDRYASVKRLAQVVICWEGTNDLYLGASAATAYANLVTYCQARKAKGLKVVIGTLMPRSNGGTPGTFEADRQTVNTSIRSNWPTFADVLADPGNDGTIGQAGQQLNTTYYTDQCHMTNAGYEIIATYMAAAVKALL